MRKRITDMTTPRVHLTRRSGNAKTGPIPVSTTEASSCPTCAFKGNGCYAESGKLRFHWDKVSAGERGGTWAEFCEEVRALPDGTFWRHNQAGDLPHTKGVVDKEKMVLLAGANANKRGFTYTHHDVGVNLKTLWAINEMGFTINLSANSPSGADALMYTRLPVVCVLPVDQTENLTTPAGHPIVVCPAITNEGATCASCQLCAERDRTVVIGFPAHGNAKRRVERIVQLQEST
jgi:hypothetical protein